MAEGIVRITELGRHNRFDYVEQLLVVGLGKSLKFSDARRAFRRAGVIFLRGVFGTRAIRVYFGA